MLEDKKISIIIPSYKCEKYLEKLLISIQNQTKQPFEIIIIDSKSDLVAIQKITKLYDHLNIVIKQIKSSSFPGNKRNLGAKISNGEILAFLDLKTLPKKDWLENGYHADMEYLENPKRQEPASSIDPSYISNPATLYQ